MVSLFDRQIRGVRFVLFVKIEFQRLPILPRTPVFALGVNVKMKSTRSMAPRAVWHTPWESEAPLHVGMMGVQREVPFRVSVATPQERL